MIIEFQDTHDTFDHDKFQAWRRQNDRGFFVNVKSPNDIMLHRVICQHYGTFDWERDPRKGWGNLTRSRKLCADSVSELQQLVGEEHIGAKLKECGNCKPT